MKTTKYLYGIVFTLALGVMACGGKKADEHGHDHEHGDSTAAAEEEWKAMDDFHMIMAESFHPYKDSANLAPAKANAAAMASSADAWANAALPEKVNTDEMKAKLQTLKTDTQAFATSVGTADDKTVAADLTKLHDEFHAIQEAWYGGKGAHHH